MDFAIRSVSFDLAQRLRMSESVVRDLAHQGEVLIASLPRLRELFCCGRASAQHVRAAVECFTGIQDTQSSAVYDERLAAVAERLRPGEFARRARRLRERLCTDTLQERHDAARRLRRVTVEPAGDAMGWLHVYAPMTDIACAELRITAEARRSRHLPGETRTLDQLRADLVTRWLTGEGTGTDAAGEATAGGGAAHVQPFLLIDAAGRFAELLGYGPIPTRTAGLALRDAPAFRRVLADPARPANLNLDSTRYRPTPDQRRWLTLRYGLDDEAASFISPGITCGAEIDHVIEWQHGGPTNVANLLPLKPRLHRLKTVTRIRLDPRPGGGVRVSTPTGYDTDPPPF